MFRRKPIPTEIRRNCDELLDIYAEINSELMKDMEQRYKYPLWICPVFDCGKSVHLPAPSICWNHDKRMVAAAVPNR